MILLYIRSSLIGSWNFCQMKTFINYTLGIQEEPNLKTVIGTMAHKSLEILALCKLNEQNGWPEDINDEAFGLIERHFPYDNSSGVNEIIDKVYKYYSEKSTKQFDEKKDKKTLTKHVNTVLEYKNGIYDPRKTNVFAVERHFDIKLTSPWSQYTYELNGEKFSTNLCIKGTVDLIMDVGNNTIEVIDYKTGKRLDWSKATPTVKEYEDLCKDTQLMFYYYALRKMYPDKNILFTIFFTQDGGPFTLCFDDEDVEKMDKFLENKANEIWKATPAMLSSQQTHFKCTKMCDYYKNKWEGSDKNICRYVADYMKVHGVQITTENLKDKNFTLGSYQNPGT